MAIKNLSIVSKLASILNKLGSLTGDAIDVDAADNWAIVFCKINAGSTSADYPAAKTTILSSPHIDAVELVIDAEELKADIAALGWTPEAGEGLKLYVSAHPRVESTA